MIHKAFQTLKPRFAIQPAIRCLGTKDKAMALGQDKVHFLDITSALPAPNKAWSPNTFRTRLVLNYKRIPYTQSYLSYPSISPVLRSLNIPPLFNGPVPYTLPAIIHAPSITANATNHAMNDSWPLALHLESAFPAPAHPSIFPTPASYALAVAVQSIVAKILANGSSLHLPKVPPYLEPACAEYFYRTRAIRFGEPLTTYAAKGEALERVWSVIEKEMQTLAEMLRGKDGMSKKTGPFFEGEVPGYADFIVVAFLGWYLRNDRADWEKMISFGKEGEFMKLWEACLPWLEGQGEEVEYPLPDPSRLKDDADSGPIPFKAA